MSASLPEWATLLADAVTKPGVISEAYRRFWNYSVGNQLLALFQCAMRDLEPGPIHTFRGWRSLGRNVKRGEKAITLCMPVTVKKKLKQQTLDLKLMRGGEEAERQPAGKGEDTPEKDATVNMTVFTYKSNWFVLSQTEGADYVPTELPDWAEARALSNLGIDRIHFDHPNGNCQGYARQRQVSVSPIAMLPHKTLFHELAHVILGHTEEGNTLDDHDRTPVNVREVEAESVALICCESLKLAGSAECRGYIQHWLGKEIISDRSAQRIFKVADAILKAGYPTERADEV